MLNRQIVFEPITTTIIFQVGWALIMLAQNVTHLYIARFLNGLTGGGAYVITPAFVAEIAEDK